MIFCCWDIEPSTLRTVLIFPEIFFKDLVNSGGTVGWPSEEGGKEAHSACLGDKQGLYSKAVPVWSGASTVLLRSDSVMSKVTFFAVGGWDGPPNCG